jgi:hypothetical protein
MSFDLSFENEEQNKNLLVKLIILQRTSMASAAVQHSIGSEHFGTSNEHYIQHTGAVSTTVKTNSYQPRDVTTIFNYYKDNEDGSPPHPLMSEGQRPTTDPPSH